MLSRPLKCGNNETTTLRDTTMTFPTCSHVSGPCFLAFRTRRYCLCTEAGRELWHRPRVPVYVEALPYQTFFLPLYSRTRESIRQCVVFWIFGMSSIWQRPRLRGSIAISNLFFTFLFAYKGIYKSLHGLVDPRFLLLTLFGRDPSTRGTILNQFL